MTARRQERRRARTAADDEMASAAAAPGAAPGAAAALLCQAHAHAPSAVPTRRALVAGLATALCLHTQQCMCLCVCVCEVLFCCSRPASPSSPASCRLHASVFVCAWGQRMFLRAKGVVGVSPACFYVAYGPLGSYIACVCVCLLVWGVCVDTEMCVRGREER